MAFDANLRYLPTGLKCWVDIYTLKKDSLLHLYGYKIGDKILVTKLSENEIFLDKYSITLRDSTELPTEWLVFDKIEEK